MAEEHVQSSLGSNLAVDVVSTNRLMGADQKETLVLLSNHDCLRFHRPEREILVQAITTPNREILMKFRSMFTAMLVLGLMASISTVPGTARRAEASFTRAAPRKFLFSSSRSWRRWPIPTTRSRHSWRRSPASAQADLRAELAARAGLHHGARDPIRVLRRATSRPCVRVHAHFPERERRCKVDARDIAFDGDVARQLRQVHRHSAGPPGSGFSPPTLVLGHLESTTSPNRDPGRPAPAR